VEACGDQLRPVEAYPCRLPPATLGVTHGIVEHQMLLAQAVIQEDPRVFEQALYAYPMCRSKRTVDAFMAEMKELNADDLPPWMK
jgi:alpha-galactosidase/6-phospho-beta-glucosidase family protein